MGASVKVVPGLDYAARPWRVSRDAVGPRAAAAAMVPAATPAAAKEAALADEIERALDAAFPGGCDLLHVHNPLIAKNGAFLGALSELQRRGRRLLVQAHDFAEDFRPEVYSAFGDYPASCAYAAINRRDRDALVASGLDPRHVHLLPNPVALPSEFDARRGWREEMRRGRRTVLYPVRAIRRKNLGEVLLLSRFLPEGADLAVTLPPTNERDLPTYSAWKKLAAERSLRVRFEAGLAAQLSDLYRSSFCVLTTSVKEGFGYSYLDPLARGIPVAGREIPHVVADFRADGIELPGLYRDIRIPLAAISPKSLRESVDLRIEAFRRAYSPSFAAGGTSALRDFEDILAALARRFEGDWVDFGALDEGLQSRLLVGLDSDRSLERSLCELNPFLPAVFAVGLSREKTEEQRAVLAAAYSEETYAERLKLAYRDALSEGTGGSIDRRALLKSYLRPESFFLAAS